MKPQYSILLMDMDNTIFDFEQSEKSALLKTAEHLNLLWDFERFEKTFHQVNKALWLLLEKGEITADYIKTNRFNQVVDLLDLKVDPVKLSLFYMEALSTCAPLLPKALEVCSLLSENYRLAILTNGLKNVQEGRLKRSGIAHLFEKVIISEVVGFNKPHQAIFECALNAMNCSDKNTVLMIGDSLKADIEGAVNFGIDALWVNVKGHELPKEPKYKWSVNHLEALYNYL